MLKRIRKLFVRPAKTADAVEAPSVHLGPRVAHKPINRADLDVDAVKIVRRLTRFDHQAYLVGGCVRDLLLERKPKDFDVGTSATPGQIRRLFRNCRIIGRRFRLAHIYFQNGKIIEVATFRTRDNIDPGESDPGEDRGDKGEKEDLLIREDNVFGTAEQDALRRDFTINALFYDVNEENVIDYADGLADLRRKLVRTIGEPDIRFREDPIRVLRAIKFAARLDFTIEDKTLQALRDTREEIRKAAPPRVLEELNRFCRGGAAKRSFELMQETGVLDVILPEIVEGCSRRPGSWELMLELFGHMDEQRTKERREIRTGEILAVLMLPPLAERLGWNADGTVETREGLELREVVDATLRPLALGLRVPRREQELCRQILTSLARMVPTSRVRRGQKRSIMNRECLPDALWILDVLGRKLGGEFSTAFEFWRSGRPKQKGKDDRAPAGRPDRSGEGGEPKGERSRRRRGPRRRKSGERRTPEQKAPAREGKPDANQQDMPPPWDDDYFFAALPTAPEGDAHKDDANTDRYGASNLRGAEQPAADGPVTDAGGAPADNAGETDSGTSAAPDRPRRKRRRRRRRPAEDRTRQNDAAASDPPEDAAPESGSKDESQPG